MTGFLFRQLFDGASSTYTYLLADSLQKKAILIDPVLEQVQRDLTLLRELELQLCYILETHVHADHITGANELHNATGAKIAISQLSGAHADLMLTDGEKIVCGSLELTAISTPGHTSSCMSFLNAKEKMVFTGDALLIRKVGRTDFQGGSAETLFESIQKKLFKLPPDTLVYPGHDYSGQTVSTIGEEMQHNLRIAKKTKKQFVEIMNGMNLPKPKLIDIAVPRNILCGKQK